jgi:hypothetical protein
MDYQRPDPENGPSPSGPRVEDDFVRPLKPMRTISHRRLPAALPFAIAGILVVSSVAFGATFIKNVINPTSSATPGVIVGHDPSNSAEASVSSAPSVVEEEPSVDSSVEPSTAPTPGTLTLTVEALPGKAKLTWSAYTGDDFAYYKVVRSDDASAPTWPLGEGDKLVAAIDNKDTLTYTDGCGAGTVSYRVFAVKKSGDEYDVLAQSAAKTVTVEAPESSEPPVGSEKPAPPVQSLTLTATIDGSEVDLSWSKYTGDHFQYYKVVRSQSSDPTWPLSGDSQLLAAITNVNETTFVDKEVRAGHTYHYRVYAYTHETFAAADSGSVAVPACETDGTILAVSNIATVTMPGTDTPPPVVELSLTATVRDDGSVDLTWSKYTGDYFNYYAVVRVDGTGEPTLEPGTTPKVYFDDQNKTSWTDDGSSDLGDLVPGHTYTYRVYAYSETAFGDVEPACTVVTILAVSPPRTVTIPEPAEDSPAPSSSGHRK